MGGRYAVSFDDVRRVARSALRHRIHRSFEAESEGVSNDEIARRVVAATPVECPSTRPPAPGHARGGAS